MESFNGILMMF